MSKRITPPARAPRALPIEVDAGGRSLLGMSPQAFLRDYWQKRPLLVRNAFPGFVSPIEPGDLAGLACEEAALSRLIQHDRARDGWSVRSGPFEEAEFPAMPDHDWTLLVQDVDKWDPDIAALLEAFDFLPRWRIDDIMVSFAAPGGSVGAHVDQYDVFLLQAHGHRRWQIDASPNPPLAFRDDVDLKLLRSFSASHDWVLAPGDMLYLPPGVPHNGVAEDACLTFSVGMRAPSAAELIGDYLDTLVADADEGIRYQDRDLTVPADPFEIDAAAMGRVVEALNALRMNDPDRLGEWFGRFITTYRSAGTAAVPEHAPDRAEVEAALAQGAVLQRHPMTRMAWRRARKGAVLFASGQALPMPLRDARLLAAAEVLDQAAYQTLGEAGRAATSVLVSSGHYLLPGSDEDDHDFDTD
ncbi:cupin domain-containing protein [Pseudoxanthomonas winnipegensis]|jgi:50S ribosomal protein L16 3-hydroxylase|uniref:Cupin domain-containing protein n=1 Tax=Pseudoxanthomonas winnipegensis TaxID=2480810 RepID=A0ABY1WFY3_9GAMM|nr:cupin domain-containing protein [Pseudoxanthomonas winnipegensis]TAA20856.1 cupin domain-containing protein [Pseudoxanthomonas winnipegensis]TAH72326.1 cupin domain-containing protein [Pseudoxanthomonas winnipegensis]